jgi:hypothetical protein
MFHPIRKALYASAFALGVFAISNTSQGAAVFIFEEASAPGLDGGAGGGAGELGSSVAATDGENSIVVTLATVDIIGFVDNSETSALTTASGSGTHTTNIAASQEALAINSDGSGGYGSESNNFNPGEGWVFSFNVDVELVEIDFESFGEVGTGMTIASSAFTTIDVQISDLQTIGSDADHYVFASGINVPAGTSITIAMTQSGAFNAADSIRIEGLTVNAVPEPSGSVLVLVGGGLLCLSRKRRNA